MTKILADTNILIYASVNDGSEKHKKAKDFIISKINEGSLVISIQNLVEFSRVLKEKVTPAIDPNTINNYISGFCANCDILCYSPETILRANILCDLLGVHFFDSLLIATMQENSILEIATENKKDFKKVANMVVINPV
ncbi:MAG: hypothetical protein COT55_00625 [Candidatus Diapherotrites archaeon CG09_land_8_20_14_0_10_32_12]|nr:MAG: hypothetical protein COT55_00625 [Candidatus Diapherotrites archaeon CG09_land_8_20_14_0_10_32_12]